VTTVTLQKTDNVNIKEHSGG